MLSFLIRLVSKASILGSVELFVKKGSDINLTCVTMTDEHEQPPSPLMAATPVNKTPHYFTWHHNGQVYSNLFTLLIDHHHRRKEKCT